MNDMEDAVEVETKVTIDWAALGRHMGQHVRSDDQAAFFMGFYESVDDMQLEHIADEPIFTSDREYVAEVYGHLANCIRTRSSYSD